MKYMNILIKSQKSPNFEFQFKLELEIIFDFEFDVKTRTRLDKKIRVENSHWLKRFYDPEEKDKYLSKIISALFL